MLEHNFVMMLLSDDIGLFLQSILDFLERESRLLFMSEKIMPVSVEAFLTNARKLKDLPSSNFLTLAEALAEFRPFQGAVIEFDDAPEGGISLAMYDVIDAAGKFGGDVFKVGEYGKLWVVAMQAVLWTRYQQRKQSL